MVLGASLQPAGPVRLYFCFTTKPRMTRLEAREPYFEAMGTEIGADQSIGCNRPLGQRVSNTGPNGPRPPAFLLTLARSKTSPRMMCSGVTARCKCSGL